MTSIYPMEPEGYCTQCGAEMYMLFDRLCHTCHCSGIAPIEDTTPETRREGSGRTTYEGKCEHCGGSMWRNARGSLHSCPLSVKFAEHDTAPELPALTTPASNFEEVTSQRASLIYQSIYRAIWKHASDCVECARWAKIGYMCTDHLSLWRSLQWWGDQIEEESPATIS